MALGSFISEMGIHADFDDKLVKRIRLTNQFGFVGFLIFFFSGSSYFYIGDNLSGFITYFFAILCLAVFPLNKNGFHKFATSFTLISSGTALFYFDSYSGLASGTYLFHFPLAFAISFVFDYKEKKTMVVHYILPIILLAINFATNRELFASTFITKEQQEILFIVNLFLCIISISLFMYLTVSNSAKENELYELRINERKANENVIKSALNEKNILLAEIHHRVKNNLAIIASLFNLQLSTIENEEAKAILIDSKNRVKSMALIHDSLYKSDSLSEIDFSKYTKELIDEIHYSYPTLANNIKINTSISNVTLNVNSAIPCGLIVNELLTNCFKHAFKGRHKGTIDIIFTKHDHLIKLKIKDDGVGLKEGYDKTDSLGVLVINSLSDQLDGKCRFTVDNGTCFEMEFQQKQQ